MSAIALLSLVGLALFLPALNSNDEDMADTPVAPERPVEPEEREEPVISEPPMDPNPEPDPRPLVNPDVEGVGTPEADRITTQSDASVFGLDGNDTITANADGNGASVFGGEGEDLIFITASNINANGENGGDTFSVDGSDNTALGDSGDDFFDVDGTDATIRSGDGNATISTGIDNSGGLLSGGDRDDEIGASGINTKARGNAGDDIIRYSTANGTASGGEGAETQAVIRLEGVRDLDISRINLSTGDAATSGNDYISSGGTDGDRDAMPTISGGAGNDTIIASKIEFSSPSKVDGGAGDDLLITELFTPASELTVDTFTMGEGEDTLQITSLFGSDGPADFGLMARVTDFSPDEDVIVIDTNPFGGTSADGLGTSISLTEDAVEGATDVNIRLLDDAGSAVFNGIVRLEGVTGLSASDIALSLSEGLTIGPSYLFTATSES